MSTFRPHSRSLSRLRMTGVLALALSSLTCRDSNPLAPGLPNQLSLAVAPLLQRAALSGGPSFVSLQKVTGILTPVGGGRAYTIAASFIRDTAVLTFDVTFTGVSQRYTLALAATDTAGNTLFKSFSEVIATPGRNEPLYNVLQYVAPDTAVRFLSVALSDTTLPEGDSLTIAAIGYDSFQQRVTPLYIGWTSRDTTLARVSSRGPSAASVLGGAVESNVWIVGRAFNGTADSVLVPIRLRVGSVLLSADTLQLMTAQLATLTADVRSATDVSLDRPVGWTSLDTTIATVVGVAGAARAQSFSSPTAPLALGQVLGVRAGATRVVATSGGRSDTTVVVVAAIPVASIVITPDTLALLLGQQARFSAEPRDAQNNPLTGRTISWTSSDPVVASIAADGTLSGLTVGIATITATSEGVVATAIVRVEQTATTIARTVISPATVPLSALGDVVQLVSRSYAADSSLVAGAYSYSVSGGTTVSVDSLGLVTAIGVGNAYVVVREVGGTSDSAFVSVTQVAKRVEVSPPTQLDALGFTSSFHAAAFDGGGSLIPAAPLNWTVTDATVGVIEFAAGDSLVVRAVGNGVTQIVAAVDAVSGSSQLTVSQVAKSATVSPNALVLGLDGRARLTLGLFDANRAPMPFSSKDANWKGGEGVVDVDSIGEVHAKAFGVGGVYATVHGVESDTSRISVSDAAPSVISFSADSLTLEADGARVTVYLSLASLAPVAVVLSDPLGLVKFDRDTLIFDKGLTRSDVVITGMTDGMTTIVATDVARLFASDSLTLFVGKTGEPAFSVSGRPATRRSLALPVHVIGDR